MYPTSDQKKVFLLVYLRDRHTQDRGRWKGSSHLLYDSPNTHNGWGGTRARIQSRTPMWIAGSQLLEPHLFRVCVDRQEAGVRCQSQEPTQVLWYGVAGVLTTGLKAWAQDVFLFSSIFLWRERHGFPSAGSLCRCLQWLSWELSPGLPWWWQGHSHLNCHCCLQDVH